jgi:hypothetical protein
VTDDECRALQALLYHSCEFCWRVAAGSNKSADPISHHEPSLLKHGSDAMFDFKN